MIETKRMTCALAAAACAIASMIGIAENAVAGAIANIQLVQWGPHAPSGPVVNLRNTSGTTIASDALTYGGSFLWNGLPGSSTTPAPTIDDFVDPTASDNSTDLLTFCLELNENISWGGTYHAEILPLADLPSSGAPPGSNPAGMGSLSAELIARLWAAFYPSKVAANLPGPSGSLDAGAFQLAIWKLEYDPELMGSGSFSKSLFESGNLRLSHDDIFTNYGNNAGTGLVDRASDWIDQVLKHPGWDMARLRGLRLVGYNGGAAQDQVVQIEGGNIQRTVTPEPASMAVWVMVGAALAFPRLRRRRLGWANVELAKIDV